jgi:hypothetical protein
MAAIDSALNGLLRLVLPVAVIAAGALAVIALLDRMANDRQAAERRALIQRNAELSVSALAPGSALTCLDGAAGETIENACEKKIFADPQSAASAVAYTAARLTLLADANALTHNDSSFADAFAAVRRAVELDRYGIAAHVLANRDGCTAENCAAFAWLHDIGAIKANLKAQAFDTYVARYAAAWNMAPAVAEKAPQAEVAAPVASTPEPAAPANVPVSSKYDFPSAASIPPVSIMNPEPPLPKGAADAQAAQPDGEAAGVPVPPKRPQAQAATPPRP